MVLLHWTRAATKLETAPNHIQFNDIDITEKSTDPSPQKSWEGPYIL
jgi:hypothetical protein